MLVLPLPTSFDVKILLQVVSETGAMEERHEENIQNTDQEMDASLNNTDTTTFDCK